MIDSKKKDEMRAVLVRLVEGIDATSGDPVRVSQQYIDTEIDNAVDSISDIFHPPVTPPELTPHQALYRHLTTEHSGMDEPAGRYTMADLERQHLVHEHRGDLANKRGRGPHSH